MLARSRLLRALRPHSAPTVLALYPESVPSPATATARLHIISALIPSASDPATQSLLRTARADALICLGHLEDAADDLSATPALSDASATFPAVRQAALAVELALQSARAQRAIERLNHYLRPTMKTVKQTDLDYNAVKHQLLSRPPVPETAAVFGSGGESAHLLSWRLASLYAAGRDDEAAALLAGSTANDANAPAPTARIPSDTLRSREWKSTFGANSVVDISGLETLPRAERHPADPAIKIFGVRYDAQSAALAVADALQESVTATGGAASLGVRPWVAAYARGRLLTTFAPTAAVSVLREVIQNIATTGQLAVNAVAAPTSAAADPTLEVALGLLLRGATGKGGASPADVLNAAQSVVTAVGGHAGVLEAATKGLKDANSGQAVSPEEAVWTIGTLAASAATGRVGLLRPPRTYVSHTVRQQYRAPEGSAADEAALTSFLAGGGGATGFAKAASEAAAVLYGHHGRSAAYALAVALSGCGAHSAVVSVLDEVIGNGRFPHQGQALRLRALSLRQMGRTSDAEADDAAAEALVVPANVPIPAYTPAIEAMMATL